MPGRPVVFDFIASDRNYTGPLQKMERHTTRFGATIARVGGVGLRAFGGLGVAAVGAGVAAVTLGLKTEAGLEQAQIAFKHLTGSAAAGKKTLAELSKFAAVTPFDLPGVETAAQQLLGAGEQAKKLIPDLTAIGDAASTATNPADTFGRTVLALSQAMATGKLQGGDLLQITEAGIPIWRELAKATGKPVPELQKLSSQGKLLTEDTLPKLFAQLHRDYGGAMQEQSTTLTGVWSTFKDTISQSLAQVMVPLADMLKNILPTAGKAASDFVNNTLIPAMKTARTWWDNNKTSVGELATILKETFVPATDGTKTSIGNLSTAAGTLSHKLTGLFIAAGSLIQWWTETRISTTELMSAVYSLTIALGHAANGIGLVTGAGRHAGDSLIAFGEDGKRVAENDLKKLREQLQKLKEELERLRHNDIDVTASLRLNFSPSFTQKDWVQVRAAAGRMASGGLITRGTGPRADDVPLWGSKGEFMVNADSTRTYLPFLEWINAQRMASGGLVFGQIDRETRAVNKVEAWGTGRRMDRGLTSLLAAAGGGGPMPSSRNEAIARSVAAGMFGWIGGQWSALRSLLMGESGFRNTAQNPNSTAYGMYQFLNSTWAGVGGRKTSDPRLQSIYGDRYIKQGYGNPINAYAAWRSRSPHWYDQGGMLPTGLSLAYNGTGRPEPVGAAAGNITVNAYGSPGMDPRGLARLVRDSVMEVLADRDRRARQGKRP